MSRSLSRLLALLLMLVLVAAACGSDDDSGSETSTEGDSSQTEGGTSAGIPPEELEIWQTDLKAVGCYGGGNSGGTSGSGGGGIGSTTTLASASYSKQFTISDCSWNADTSNLLVRASAESLSLSADVASAAGTIAVSGGDGTYTATGTFAEPNNVGETFSLTGAC
jgi:hypothetical protein